MAKLTFKSGKRGRPLTLDPEAALQEIYKSLPQAKQALAEFRKSTSGVRDEAILGTATSLPEFINLTLDALEFVSKDKYSYEMARQIRDTVNITKRLASKREDVSTTALEETITTEYMEGLKKAAQVASPFAKEQYRNIARKIKRMTKKERIKYYKSKQYQDVGTFGGIRYERIKYWAESSANRKMSYKEAYAYLVATRADANLDTAEEIKEAAGDELLDW